MEHGNDNYDARRIAAAIIFCRCPFNTGPLIFQAVGQFFLFLAFLAKYGALQIVICIVFVQTQ